MDTDKNNLESLNIFSEEQLIALKEHGITTVEDFCGIASMESGKSGLMELLRIDGEKFNGIISELLNQLPNELKENILNHFPKIRKMGLKDRGEQ